MISEPNCHKRNCKYFLGVRQPNGTEETEFVYCLAFPEGIPEEIAYGDDKHLEPLSDQGNTIVFEKE